MDGFYEREGVDMYCDNCHRQSPDNFVNCPYCSAPLKNHKRKKPEKFVKTKERKKPLSFKSTVIVLVIAAFILAVCAIVTGIFTGSKPSTAINKMVAAIETNDAELYFSLYDDQIIEYYNENWYYGDAETFDAITKPLSESRDFYIEKCGENFTLDYKITEVTYITGDTLNSFNNSLGVSFNYSKYPSKAAFLNFEIEAEGEKGTYKSVYENFVCLQIGGKWYIQTAAADILADEINDN